MFCKNNDRSWLAKIFHSLRQNYVGFASFDASNSERDCTLALRKNAVRRRNITNELRFHVSSALCYVYIHMLAAYRGFKVRFRSFYFRTIRRRMLNKNFKENVETCWIALFGNEGARNVWFYKQRPFRTSLLSRSTLRDLVSWRTGFVVKLKHQMLL